MQRQRMGELLSRLVPISPHDIEEILHEQGTRHRLFGEIALSMGLCRPEHVWKAWCRQNASEIEQVDLDQMGVDAQATAHLPREAALRYGAVPLRLAGRKLLVATSPQCFEEAATCLPSIVPMNLKFVLADAQQIQRALMRYYPVA